MQRRAGGHDDGEHDRDRGAHAGDHVDAHRHEVGGRHRVSRLVTTRLRLLLDLFARLPEEQVRGDGGSEDRDQRGDLGLAAVERRDEPAQHLGPVDLHREEHHHVRRERQREVPEDPRVPVVGDEDLEHEHRRGHGDGEHGGGQRDDEMGRGAHRREIGGNVEGVRGRDEHDATEQDPSGEARADQRPEPVPRDQAEARRHLLDRRGHGENDDGGPDEREAECRPDLGVGADAGRVVVRRAGDEPRTEALEVPVAPQRSATGVMA